MPVCGMYLSEPTPPEIVLASGKWKLTNLTPEIIFFQLYNNSFMYINICVMKYKLIFIRSLQKTCICRLDASNIT